MGDKPVTYSFVKPVGCYFTDEGVLVRREIENDASEIMETFRGLLREAASKKKN